MARAKTKARPGGRAAPAPDGRTAAVRARTAKERAAGDKAAAIRFNVKQLPFFTVWKNTAGENEDVVAQSPLDQSLQFLRLIAPDPQLRHSTPGSLDEGPQHGSVAVAYLTCPGDCAGRHEFISSGQNGLFKPCFAHRWLDIAHRKRKWLRRSFLNACWAPKRRLGAYWEPTSGCSPTTIFSSSLPSFLLPLFGTH